MAPKFTIWLALHAACLIPLTNAWTLIWRNETGPIIENEYSAKTCTRIYHEKGEEFKWDPEGAWCLNFWDEPDCTTRIGLSCNGVAWTKDASRNLSAYNVYPMPDDLKSMYGFVSTTSATTATPTATTLTVTPSAETSTESSSSSSTTTPTAQPDKKKNDSSSLSGGAIAGIAIGAIAGLALIAALCFFLGKRKPKRGGSDIPPSSSAGTRTQPPPPPPMMSPPGTSDGYSGPVFVPTQPSGFPIEHKTPMSVASPTGSQYSQAAPPYSPPVNGYQHPSAGRVVELPSHVDSRRVVGTRQLSEMDGSSELNPHLR
ncbi:hypothetical protein FE257_001218 [Aspergillus nanangensis]|uniref:Uncharacterized protein n=1 Tax=Aspergillus nanangensis TaxID=2582783 RepID=A0AAD4GPT2_ASPNN|nr:hypothetical protein FE257_001218 [Aspergillus nanangensis]